MSETPTPIPPEEAAVPEAQAASPVTVEPAPATAPDPAPTATPMPTPAPAGAAPAASASTAAPVLAPAPAPAASAEVTPAPKPEPAPKPAPTPKPPVDPETLVLRGRPRRAVRFRREVIIGLVVAAVVGLLGVTWLALSPTLPRINVAASDDTPVKPNGEVLANAPKTYADSPKLGPPLPGDLGPPILAHQEGTTTVGMASSPSQTDQALAAQRQRQSEEVRAARESGVMVQIAGGDKAVQAGAAGASASATSAATDAAAAASSARMALDPDHDPGQQQRKADFVANIDTKGDINPHALNEPTSPYTLSAGTVIAASLITGINSDLPGMVSAQVTQNAYDTATGRYLLLPQGSRLIGSYDSVVAYGQKRALLVWQRIILPDGSSVRIDNVPASDASGYAGLADKVDFHSWQLIKGVVLSSLLGVSTQLSFGSNESDLLRAIRESTQQSAGRAGDQIVTRALNVQPTITVRPGWPLRVVVHKDIVMRPWGQQGRP